MIRAAATLLLLFLLVPFPTHSQEENTIYSIDVDGQARTYHLTFPASEDENPPAIIALHPLTSSGLAMRAFSGLDVAAERGYIVAYPNADGFFWNDGRSEVTGALADDVETDDAAFVRALVDELITEYNVDADRIYLTGMSTGGTMAYKMACESPELFAGVGIVSTLMWNYLVDSCPAEPAAGVDLLMLHGTRDLVYPIEGRSNTTDDGALLAALRLDITLGYWLTRNACAQDTLEEFNSSSVLYSGCLDDSRVAMYVLPGMAHNWPRIAENRVNKFGIDANAMLLDFFEGEDSWAQDPVTYEVIDKDGFDVPPRSYRYYVPTTYSASEPMPLVIVLHGRPDSGFGIAYITDMNPVAEREGFIVAYPDGLDQSWNYHYKTGVPIAKEFQGDDGQFLREFILQLSTDLNIDQERIYVTGFSNGGFMTEYLACVEQDQFAAFAVVGATLYAGLPTLCEAHEAASVPILFMHGTDDVSVLWNGTEIMPGSGRYNTYPVDLTLGYWAQRNGCSLVADYEELPRSGDSPGTFVYYNEFPDCSPGSALIFYYIDGGGHNWPGIQGRLRESIAGRVNMDINANEEIWKFFSQYTRDLEG